MVAHNVRIIIFSLVAVLAILLTPLLTASPVSADWGTDIRLTHNAVVFGHKSIAVSGNSIHIAWDDTRDNNLEIYYKRSTDGGATWGADTRLTNATAQSLGPSIAVSGNNVHVAWADNRDGTFEIYYKRSTDGGTTWGADTRLTNATAQSTYPSMAV